MVFFYLCLSVPTSSFWCFCFLAPSFLSFKMPFNLTLHSSLRRVDCSQPEEGKDRKYFHIITSPVFAWKIIFAITSCSILDKPCIWFCLESRTWVAVKISGGLKTFSCRTLLSSVQECKLITVSIFSTTFHRCLKNSPLIHVGLLYDVF